MVAILRRTRQSEFSKSSIEPIQTRGVLILYFLPLRFHQTKDIAVCIYLELMSVLDKTISSEGGE